MFTNIDGFPEQDIYCAGWGGRVCHFDGKEWRLLAFLTNVDLQSLVCTGDGSVYISGESGIVFKGRGERWKRINKADYIGLSLGFRDMVWYEDWIWCTSDYGLWTIKDDNLEGADVPSAVKMCSGNLFTADGVLLVAGYGGGAAFKENGEWKVIYGQSTTNSADISKQLNKSEDIVIQSQENLMNSTKKLQELKNELDKLLNSCKPK